MFVVGSYLDNAARMVAAAFQSNQNKPAHTHIQVSTFEIMFKKQGLWGCKNSGE
jgi:hypothetical protein